MPIATDPPSSSGPESPAPSGEPSGDPTDQPTDPPTDPPATGFDPRRVELALEEVVTGLDAPVAVTHAGDGTGTLYVVERAGLIRVLGPDGSLASEPLLDIRDRVDTQGERGLHYVVFHPDFASSGRFFVHWTNASNRSFIQEYTAEGESTVPRDSARDILTIDHPDWNHKGGWMGFGPDGMLYIAVGDGGGSTPGDPFGNGQKRTELMGNILRIDVDGERPYGIPEDNPYAVAGQERQPEIWAYGLRNPWRASFDAETGALWIGDVGQDTSEEINVIPAGEGGLNFGWSDMEGNDCHNEPDCDPADYVLPVTTYGTRDEGCAITGGYVYRGAANPLLTGGYLFTDYCSGEIWGLDAATGLETGTADYRRLLQTEHLGVSMGEDEAGELYLVDFAGGIYRISATER
ncbi:MAG: PQQ-dependent sugar dehydrogenase [Chloroflexota bacterium]|nr:PQQ-dependent sugar dehydrogenase [Chloroflexota bacterium]